MEELAQYMALKTTSGVDLDTPNGTPLKGAALRTPFKQIAEEVASESIVIDDTSALEEPPIPMRSFEKVTMCCIFALNLFRTEHTVDCYRFCQ